MEDVEQLLNDYESRKRQETAAAKERSDRNNRVADQARRVFSGTVIPVLSEVASKLSEGGHMAEVRESLDDTPSGGLYPSVVFIFRPQDVQYELSKLSLKLKVDTDLITVTKEVSTPRADDHRSTKTWPLDDISERKVRDEVMEFIKSVLDAN